MSDKKTPPAGGQSEHGAIATLENNLTACGAIVNVQNLSEAEKDVHTEKAGEFIANGYTTEEADTAALDLIFTGGIYGILPRTFGFDAVLLLAEKHGFRFIPCGTDGKPAVKWSGENQNNFTGNTGKLKAWYEQGFRRFSYLPGLSGFVGLDIDCGHADGRDGIADFYKVLEGLSEKTKDRLPSFLKDVPYNFPCYVETPSGGYHLLLKYGGQCKLANLVFEGAKIEVKCMNSMLSLGEKQNGIYTLRGNLANAPEMPRFLAELINPPPKPEPGPVTHRRGQKLDLEKIAERIIADSAGNNDRQKKFAWRAAYFGYGLNDVLSFVKLRTDIFGNDTDTETVINHAWHSNTARAS